MKRARPYIIFVPPDPLRTLILGASATDAMATIGTEFSDLPAILASSDPTMDPAATGALIAT